MYFKAKNTLHTTRISSFKYVFIVFFEKNQILRYTLYFYSFIMINIKSMYKSLNALNDNIRHNFDNLG